MIFSLNIIKRNLDLLSKLNDLFDHKEKIQFILVIILALLTAFFQAVGIASILPFINMVMNPEIITSNQNLKHIYDLFSFKTINSFIVFSGFVVVSLLVIGNTISAFTTWMKIKFAWKKNHTLSCDLLEKYMSMPYAYFLRQNTSDLGKNILFEVQQLTSNFILPIIKISTDVVIVLFILAMLIYVSPFMTILSVLILGSFYSFIYFYFSKRLKIGGKIRMEKNRKRFQAATESLCGIKDIKVLGVEDYFLNRFRKHSDRFSYLQSWCQAVGQIPHYLMETLAFGGIVGIIMFSISSGMAIQKIIPLASFFAFAGYRLMPTLQEIFNSLATIKFNAAILEKIHSEMSGGIIIHNKSTIKKFEIKPVDFKEKMVFQNVSFSYPGNNKMVIENISLEIAKNTFVALIGATGAGKTTLVDLLLGLFLPRKGIFMVDGVLINEENIKNWQMNLGYVPQQIYLSDDTVARNIAFGIPDEEIDMESVKKAAQLANIHNFIDEELSNGYDTVIGERGIRLSGGQKQRIGIARALYRDPQVLIFDEATSSLDSATEKEVLGSIEKIAKLKTMIVIAHRMTTVRNANRVYVLNKGRIIKEGCYDDIITNK